MTLHHFVTCALLVFSYISLYNTIGLQISFLHDLADISTFMVKLSSNMNIDAFTVFGAFFCLAGWLFSRIYALPFFIYYGTEEIYEGYLPRMLGSIFHYKIYRVFLCILYTMHCYWTYLLVRKIVQVVVFGDKVEDHQNVITKKEKKEK